MKFETHSLYNSAHVALAESCFVTVWSALSSWHSDLVLVGGLVPKYLCGDLKSARELPRPVTLDTDLGIGLDASCGQYGSLMIELQGQGFRLSRDEFGGPRFVRTIDDFHVLVDFLTERPPATSGTAVVDDVPANLFPGINRALASPRRMRLTGVDLFGATQSITAKICEAGPFLAMKLRAFSRRQQPKDAFDILYTLRHYDGGTKAAIAAFAEEVRLNNPACPDAIACLERDFATENSPAAVKTAHFVLGQVVPGEHADQRTRRLQIQQDVVDAGRLLKAALPPSSPRP